MRIVIEVIPHKDQVYDTCGYWRFQKDGLHIKVSALGDCRQEALIAVHELVEALLCREAGVSAEVVDKFDMEFEKNRVADNNDEPGDDPKAPYRKQHCMATGIERVVAAELGVDWREYESMLNKL